MDCSDVPKLWVRSGMSQQSKGAWADHRVVKRGTRMGWLPVMVAVLAGLVAKDDPQSVN